MVDYDRSIGGGVTLRIRDYGERIEFWIKAGSGTWNYQQPWSWAVNGSSGSANFRLEKGGAWQRVVIFGVTTDQNVRFSIQNSGLGFPSYDFIQHINRVKVPPPPSSVYFDTLTATSVVAHFNSQGDGGSGILEWQLAYGTNPYTAQNYIGSGGTNAISGLAPGTTYYFWARGRNAVGWGGWSTRTQITTQRIPDPPVPMLLTEATPTSVRAQFNGGNYNGGTPFTGHEIAYGRDPNTPQFFVQTVNQVFTGLDRGQTYYFWGRSANAIGWGPYSARSEVTLVAGSYVNDVGVAKRAIPWVKDAGVWKIAKPWVNVDGIWKATV